MDDIAAKLGLPLNTISCHDDLAAADFTGRGLLIGGEPVLGSSPPFAPKFIVRLMRFQTAGKKDRTSSLGLSADL